MNKSSLLFVAFVLGAFAPSMAQADPVKTTAGAPLLTQHGSSVSTKTSSSNALPSVEVMDFDAPPRDKAPQEKMRHGRGTHEGMPQPGMAQEKTPHGMMAPSHTSAPKHVKAHKRSQECVTTHKGTHPGVKNKCAKPTHHVKKHRRAKK